MKHHSHYKHIFFDLDHTLWDFETNSANCLVDLVTNFELEEKYGIGFERFYAKYKVFNQLYWELYSKGQVDKDELRYVRFYKTFLEFGLDDMALSKSVSTTYTNECPKLGALIPGALEVLQLLQERGVDINLITNGFEEVQMVKLKHSGLEDIITRMITSEAAGFQKPDKRMFHYAFNEVGEKGGESCLMIGDNWHADIVGGNNVGMDTVWISTEQAPDEVATAQFKDLKPLFDFWQ